MAGPEAARRKRRGPAHSGSEGAWLAKRPDRLWGAYTYIQVSEDDGSVGGSVLLARAGDTISETVGGRVVRRFELSGGACVRIDWDGAFSAICASPEESVAGSGIDFVT